MTQVIEMKQRVKVWTGADLPRRPLQGEEEQERQWHFRQRSRQQSDSTWLDY